MDETKKCPYCGEEIKLLAKKCRYCGEWLEEKPRDSQESSEVSSTVAETPVPEIPPIVSETSNEIPEVPNRVVETPNAIPNEQPHAENARPTINYMQTFLSGWVWPVAILAFLAEIVIAVHSYCDMGWSVGSSGKVGYIMEAAQYVPEWVGYLCSGIAWALFNWALMDGLQKYPSVSTLATFNFVAGFAVVVLNIINNIDSVADSDEAAMVAIGLLFLLIAYLVIVIWFGIKLITAFEGEITNVGKWMIAYCVSELLVAIIVACLPWEYSYVALFLYAIFLYVTYQYIAKLYELLN